MRLRRHLLRVVAALVLGTVPVAVGIVVVLLYTTSGRLLLAREISTRLSRALNGRFEVGAIGGSFVSDLVLDRVVVRDTAGELLASLPHAEVRYRLPNLLGGRIIIDHVRLLQPVIYITKHPNRRMNYEDVLRLGLGPPGGPSPLVEFRDVRVVGGLLRLALPWSPPDTATTDELRAAALAADRARPGRVIEDSREGLRKVITFNPLTVTFRQLRVATPDHKPLAFVIDTLATRMSDPAITVTNLVAGGWTAGDSLKFTVTRGALPRTDFSGGGAVTWPRRIPLYDFRFDVPRLDLADLHWVSPLFPDLRGRARVIARSESDTRTDYDVRALSLSRGPTLVEGSVVAVTDGNRGLGVRDMDLRLTLLDLDDVRRYLDTLPLHGTLTGTVRGDGFLDDLNLDADVVFRDARVPGEAENHVAMQGRLSFGGRQGTVLHQVTVSASDLDLRSVRLLAPAVILHGRAQAEGTLDGPWRDVTFDGDLVHRDGERPESRASGTVTLDTRGDTLGLDMDVELAPLSFEGIRPAFPALVSRGTLEGTVRTSGTLARLDVNANLHGEIGKVRAEGGVTLLPPRWGASRLQLVFNDLDLAALRGGGPATRLNGTLAADGLLDTLRAPEGTLDLGLGPSRIREFAFDTAIVRLAVHDSLIRLDTLDLRWPAGGATGAGSLGWGGGHSGALRIALSADSLGVFDSLAVVLSGMARDTARSSRPLEGAARVDLALSGSLDSLQADLGGAAHDVGWRRFRSPAIEGRLSWTGGRRPRLAAAIGADSLSAGEWYALGLSAAVSGFADSLEWSGAIGVGAASRAAAAGRWWRSDGVSRMVVDTLVAVLESRPWRLVRPLELALGDSTVLLDRLAFEADDGSGWIRASGRVPGTGPGKLTLSVLGLQVRDLYALAELDTSGVSGSVALDLDVGGTARSPTIRGSGTIADAIFSDFRAPLVQAVLDYADRRIDANLLLWQTGQQVLKVEARLPIDLAFGKVARRQVEGNLLVRASADSTDLGIIEAVTPFVRQVQGGFIADAEIIGSWDAPRLSGFLKIYSGGVSLPALGIRLDGLAGKATLTGDSVRIDTLRTTSGGGLLQVGGGIRLEALTRPLLDLTLSADHFQALNVRNFASLVASGRLALTGPVVDATLTGALTANEGAFYFADLVTKRIVDIENPEDSTLLDRSVIREQRLGAGFVSRFLDSLTIRNLRLAMGESFWLRSGEANIQLDDSIIVSKQRGKYRVDGTLKALRGNYVLKIGFVARDFIVERGTVRYFGTPDLNAELDIEARHTVRTAQTSDEIPVIATITGTMLAPKLTLSSTVRPPLSETELVSYLMFGQATFGLTATGSPQGADQLAAVRTAMSYLSSALSSEVQRTLVSDLGVPIDYLNIQTGAVGAPGTAGQAATATQLAQVAAGWQIGRQFFVVVNADICTNVARFYPNVEYRISREFRLKASVEPTKPCNAIRTGETLSTFNKYQLGFDVLWEREQ